MNQQTGFVVVHKHPGLDMHDKNDTPGLCSLARAALGRPVYPVHRLDKDTSGLVLLATDRNGASGLARLFRQGAVEKYYLALSDCTPQKKQGRIQGDMVRSRRGTWKLTRGRTNPARTRFFSWPVQPGLRLFVLRLFTGRTHQARVAMKSLGAPVLGDRLYHPRTPSWPDRMYLHAWSLRFTFQGHEHEYTCLPAHGDFFLAENTLRALHDVGPAHGLPWGTHNTPRAR